MLDLLSALFLEFAKIMNNDFIFVLFLYGVSVVLAFDRYGLKGVERFSVYFILGVLLVWGFKNIFYKERVCVYEYIECPTNSSFPSGHTMLSFITALFFYRDRKELFWLLLLAIAISASRMVLGVHGLDDIIGGYGFALFYFSLWWKNGWL